MSASAPKIAVIGAGITGITTAYALLERGYAVTVYDRQRYAAMETSFANGGQLSASNAEVWNSWSNVRKGMGWLLQADAPLKLNLTPSLRKYRWLFEFLTHIGDYERNTVESAKLAIRARESLRRMAEREQIQFDQLQRGILHIYANEKGFAHAKRVNALYAQAGLERQELAPADVRAIEPTVQGDLVGGFFTESDATGDIHKFTRGLADACVRHGATVHYEAAVTVRPASGGGVIVSHDGDETRYDIGVVCAGVGSTAIAKALGDRVNVYPVKGYSITVELHDKASREAAPQVSLLDDDAKVVTARLGDRFRIAGTAEFTGENRDIREARIAPLVNWTQRYFPGIATDKVRPWAGLRPMTPSLMPRVGPGRRPGVYYNTGHGHLGWTLSAATADIVADTISGRAAA